MKKSNKKQLVKRGKWWFRAVKNILTCFYKYPDIIYLEGKPFEETSVILSNHEGSYSPISLEMYLNNVYLGSGSYGVAGAADIYFKKNLKGVSLHN